MDFGDVLVALGLDLQVLQGAVTHVYLQDEGMQVVEGPGGSFRLELAVPLIEAREPCGELPFRMGLHLLGDLFIGGAPAATVFDTWIRLRPEVVDGDDGLPVGALAFDGLEGVRPDIARDAVLAQVQPGGTIGDALARMRLPLFGSLLVSVTEVFDPPDDPEAEVEVDLADWDVALTLGTPAELPRPVFDVRGRDDDAEVILESDGTIATVPALVATVARAGDPAAIPGERSIVRPGAGMQLVTTKAMFDARLDREGAAQVGSEVEGLTIDRMELEAVDGGITVDGAGHKTGADVTFVGTVVARYLGGTDGHLVMKPAIDTDIDQDWWVQVLSVVAALVPGLGWILGEVFIWGPTREAPEQVDEALREEFGDSLRAIGAEVAAGFGIEPEEGEDPIPSAAFLHDIWVFDGNLGVSVAAFLGHTPAGIAGVTYDQAFITLDRRDPRRRPVTSVAELTLTTGHVLQPWQAAALVRDGIVDIPRHHVVRNPRAREGLFLRSDPNASLADNLVR